MGEELVWTSEGKNWESLRTPDGHVVASIYLTAIDFEIRCSLCPEWENTASPFDDWEETKKFVEAQYLLVK